MAAETAPPKETRRHVDTVDIAIVGAGPAGMAAAVTARRHGATVALLDEQFGAGGQIYRGVAGASSERLRMLGPDYAAGAELTREFAASGSMHITGAAAWQVTPQHQVHYSQAGVLRSVHAQRVLLCTGAMERPFPIPGWTLTGVMTAGSAQILLKGSGMTPRSPVVLAGCGPLLYLLGWQYVRAGVSIAAIVDTTSAADYSRATLHAVGALVGWRYLKKGLELMASLRRAGVSFYGGASDLHVMGEREAQGLRFTSGGKPREVRSPLVLLHQGIVPNTQFTWSLRAKHAWSEAQLCWVPATDAWGELDVPGIFVAGDGGGIGGASVAALQGKLVGLAAAAQLHKLDDSTRDELALPIRTQIRRQSSIRPFLDALYRPKPANRIPADQTIVCRCEEVTAGQLRNFVRLGCDGPNQVKSFGRCGMGPCQGRQCGLTVTEVIAEARGVAPEDVGYYRIRPPIKPITLGELANEA